MPILNKGTTFANNDQVTSAKLNNLVDTADFTNTSGTAIDSSGTTGTCVSDGGLEVTDPGGQLQIKASGVTKDKIENVANMKVLGNTSGSAAAPQEVTINDTDDMSDASATTLATSESVKAYVDANNTGASYNLFRTIDGRGGASSSTFKNWSTNLMGTTNLGAFGTGSSGVDRPFIFTFSSTGTPAVFLHPSEAQHGDLGILQKNDILLVVSNSGKTRELIELTELSRRLNPKVKIICLSGKSESELSALSDLTLSTGEPQEVCPLGLTPTTSTTCMTIVGDILVVLMMEKIGFTKEEYAKRHHSGYLGQKAKNENG